MTQQTVLPFKLEMTDEVLTPRAGLALVGEYLHGLGLHRALARELPEPGSGRGRKAVVYAEPIILMQLGGGRCIEDLRILEGDKGLKKVLKYEIPSVSATGDWLRRMGNPAKRAKGLKGLERVQIAHCHQVMRREPFSEYTLDLDATAIEANKREAQMTYKGFKGYMPLEGYLAENGLKIYEEFREGNESPSKGLLEALKECQRRMPQGKKIKRFRSDSAAYQAGIINHCEEDQIEYTITADQDSAVKKAIEAIPAEDWKPMKDRDGAWIAETVHSMEHTKKAFRLIVLKERELQLSLWGEGPKERYHAVASNFPEKWDAEKVLEWHNGRGNAENYIKESKIGFGLETLPCGESYANAVWYRLGSIAYNVLIGFKRLCCPPEWMYHTVATLRWRLFETAARVVKHGRSIILKIAAGLEKYNLFREIRENISALCRPG